MIEVNLGGVWGNWGGGGGVFCSAERKFNHQNENRASRGCGRLVLCPLSGRGIKTRTPAADSHGMCKLPSFLWTPGDVSEIVIIQTMFTLTLRQLPYRPCSHWLRDSYHTDHVH